MLNTQQKGFDEMRDNWPSDQVAAKQWLEERLHRVTKDGVFAEVIRLTPALATEFLSHNADNRPIRAAKLKQVTDEIAAGRYMLNGESIIFADTGQMNDGQHRCQGVVETMRPVDTVIVFGVTRESRRTVDNGAARSPGDHLSVEGFTYSNDMASVGRFVLAWEKSDRKSLTAMNRVAPTMIVDRGLDDPRIHEAAVFGRTHYTKAPVAAPSVIGFAYYAFSAVDKAAAEDFLKKVIYGANLDPNGAAYQVRETLLAMDRRVREHRVEYLFAGFMAHRAGAGIGKYKIRNDLVPLGAPATAAPSPSPEEAPVAGGEIVKLAAPAKDKKDTKPVVAAKSPRKKATA